MIFKRILRYWLHWVFVIMVSVGARESYSQSIKLKARPHIEVRFVGEIVPDTFRIIVFENLFPFSTALSEVPITAKRQPNGSYNFSLPRMGRPFYISLFKDFTTYNYPIEILKHYLVEENDAIIIDIKEREVRNNPYSEKEYDIVFSGLGAFKYECRYGVINRLRLHEYYDAAIIDSSGAFIENNFFDRQKAKTNLYLEKYRKKITGIAYDILKADLFSLIEIARLEKLSLYHSSDLQDSLKLGKVRRAYQRMVEREDSGIAILAKIVSASYNQYVLDKISIGKYKKGNSKKWREDAVVSLYNLIETRYRGELRDKLMTSFIINSFRSKQFQSLLDTVFSAVQTSYCISELESFSNGNLNGKPAYEFAMPDTGGRVIKLNDFRGKVIFIDFWFNGCFGCAHYYKTVVSHVEEHYKSNDSVVFITISIDTDKTKWKQGINSGNYTSPDVINLYTDGMGADHPVIKRYRISGYPKPLVVDKYGKIFNNNEDELRGQGKEGLMRVLERAIRM